MAKIMSIDALIDSIKLAFPEMFEYHESRQPSAAYLESSIRRNWEEERYQDIYRTLDTWRVLDTWRHVTVKSITDEVLRLVDESEDTPAEILEKLTPEFRKIQIWFELEPVRQQLEDDFKETFPEKFFY